MSNDLPPKVELKPGVLGAMALLRKASRNTVTAIPAELLTQPIMSGRKFWKWTSVSGPEELEHVLVARADNYPRSRVVRSLMGPALRHSLFLADAHAHRWQRRAVLDAYSARRCRGHVPLFHAAAESQLARLPETSRFTMDAAPMIEAITLTASLKTACATYEIGNIDALREAMDAYSDASLRVTLLDILKLPLTLAARLKTFGAGPLDGLQRAFWTQIERRAAAGDDGPDDLLQRLLEMRDPDTGRPLSRRQVLDNIMMMVVAGHEPPASALSWAVYLLATHPDAQERARAEVTSEDADQDLPYLTAVIDETMRLYPIVPILLRDTVASDQVGGCPVSSGSFMFVPIYATHRSPRHWPDPDLFAPERFLTDDVPKGAFLPFSTGSYSCIGKTFSMVEIRTVLAELLRRFRFRAVPGKAPAPMAVMSLRPKGGVWIEVERL